MRCWAVRATGPHRGRGQRGGRSACRSRGTGNQDCDPGPEETHRDGEHDRDLHGWRHPSGNALAERKAFRGMAMRAVRGVVGVPAFMTLVAGVIAGRWVWAGPK